MNKKEKSRKNTEPKSNNGKNRSMTMLCSSKKDFAKQKKASNIANNK